MRLDPKLICIWFLLVAIFFQHYKGGEQVSSDGSDQSLGGRGSASGESEVPMSLKLADRNGNADDCDPPAIDERTKRAVKCPFGFDLGGRYNYNKNISTFVEKHYCWWCRNGDDIIEFSKRRYVSELDYRERQKGPKPKVIDGKMRDIVMIPYQNVPPEAGGELGFETYPYNLRWGAYKHKNRRTQKLEAVLCHNKEWMLVVKTNINSRGSNVKPGETFEVVGDMCRYYHDWVTGHLLGSYYECLEKPGIINAWSSKKFNTYPEPYGKEKKPENFPINRHDPRWGEEDPRHHTALGHYGKHHRVVNTLHGPDGIVQDLDDSWMDLHPFLQQEDIPTAENENEESPEQNGTDPQPGEIPTAGNEHEESPEQGAADVVKGKTEDDNPDVRPNKRKHSDASESEQEGPHDSKKRKGQSGHSNGD